MSSFYTRLLQFAQQFQKFYTRQFSPMMEQSGLTMCEIDVLLFLANNPPMILPGISRSCVDSPSLRSPRLSTIW
jgi:DNA-binding MarR family transcriptional regulator